MVDRLSWTVSRTCSERSPERSSANRWAAATRVSRARKKLSWRFDCLAVTRAGGREDELAPPARILEG